MCFAIKPLEQLLSPIIHNLDSTISQSLSEKEARWVEKVRQAKIDLLNRRINPSQVDMIRPVIVESWLRSHNFGVNPVGYPKVPVLDKDAFSERLETKEYFLKASTASISQMENVLSDTNCFMLLTDEYGTILRVFGGNFKAVEQERRSFQLIPGAIWAEDTVGTCSHGMSILTGNPIQIFGPEHYSQVFEQRTCSSAPIFDANNNLEGTISLATHYAHHQNSHSLGLVVTMACVIQKEFQLSINNELLNTAIKSTDQAVITLDKHGVIMNANLTAKKVLNYHKQDWIGLHIEEIFGKQPLITSVLENGQPVLDAELINNQANQRLFLSSAQPVKNHYGKIFGYVLTLKQIDRFRKTNKQTENLKTRFTFDNILGDSCQIKESIRIANKFATLDANVLIQGESGTGKELFAQSIHNASRPNGPFIAENCAAIPKTLIESELFGYESGSFTGAERQGRVGKIEQANGGTLFLDEIGDMPLELQTILLRVLQDKRVKRVGGSHYIPVDFRLVTATNKDLLDLLEKKQFREDLYYRIAVFKIYIPPLRERGTDIITLVNHFISSISKKQKIPAPTLSKKAIYTLLQYNWPGNVRQLENVVLYAVNMSSDGIIHPENFPDEIYRNINISYSHEDYPESILDPQNCNNSSNSNAQNKFTAKEFEEIAIRQALAKTNNHVANAAALLKISKATLYRKINNMNINLK